MNQRICSAEMTALLTGLMTAQWFSSTAAGFVDACGNAVFLAILLAGILLSLITCVSIVTAPQVGWLVACRRHSALRPFPLLAALLFLLLAATALRDVLSMISLSLLPKTPRWCTLLFLLPLLLAIGFWGTASVSRTIKLLAPLLIVLYLIVLVLSVWNQFNVYNFFPILGGGISAIGKTTFSALSVIAWIPLLWIHRPNLTHPVRTGLRSCIYASILGVIGYLFYALLFPNGSTTDVAFPLHRLSISGGLSYAFQRVQALFVFVWLPLQIAAIGTGLCTAVRCAADTFSLQRPQRLVPVLLLIIAALGFKDVDASPAWVRFLLQTNIQALLLLPMLIPLFIGKIGELRHPKEESRHDA